MRDAPSKGHGHGNPGQLVHENPTMSNVASSIVNNPILLTAAQVRRD